MPTLGLIWSFVLGEKNLNEIWYMNWNHGTWKVTHLGQTWTSVLWRCPEGLTKWGLSGLLDKAISIKHLVRIMFNLVKPTLIPLHDHKWLLRSLQIRHKGDKSWVNLHFYLFSNTNSYISMKSRDAKSEEISFTFIPHWRLVM